MALTRWVGRAIGLDVHRDFCVVAICEDGRGAHRRGRVPSTPEGLELFAAEPGGVGSGGVGGDRQLLGGRADPRAARATGWSWSARMTPGSRRRARRPTGSTRARWRGCCGRASLSRCGCPMSAAACCAAGWRGASSWCTRARARRTRSTRCCSAACRASRRARTCSASRAAGGWPGSSCRSRSASPSTPGIRHIEFLDAEIAAVERLIAQQALAWPEIRRLMTVPGVNLICAATFIAAVGDPRRFLTSRKLVAYLGLDPKVRQSGDAPARSGRISKRGSASARWALVEAAWSVVLQPGPLHAFYERTRARRGHGKAIVATARKLAVLFWCMLTRGEDYAHQQPSLTKQEAAPARDHRRRPEIRQDRPRDLEQPTTRSARPSASSPRRPRPPTSGWSTDQQAGSPGEKGGRERDTGARINQALEGQSRAADPQLQTPALRLVIASRPHDNLTPPHRRRPPPTLTTRAQNPATTTPIGTAAGPTGPTEADLRPSATPPRPIRSPKSARNCPRALDFHRSSRAGVSSAPAKLLAAGSSDAVWMPTSRPA